MKHPEVDVYRVGGPVIAGSNNNCPGAAQTMHERDSHPLMRDGCQCCVPQFV